MKPWLLYSLARLGIFAAALAILLVLGLPWYFAAIVAAIIGLLVSYIALPKLRHEVTASLAARREIREHDADTDFEDAQLDLDDERNPHAEPISDARRHAERRAADGTPRVTNAPTGSDAVPVQPAGSGDAASTQSSRPEDAVPTPPSGLERERHPESDGVHQCRDG